MNNSKIYAELLEDQALAQYNSAMELDCVVQGALMPDAHTGYSLPIGAVVKTKGKIFPSWIGYDIGCGVCAYKTEYKREDIEPHRDDIFASIYRAVPTGFNKHKEPQQWEDERKFENVSDVCIQIIDNDRLKSLGTLGGGNHFIEISYDEDNYVWIVIHSGSRGIGHKVASHYMALAKAESIDTSEIEKDFEFTRQVFKEKKPKEYKAALEKHIRNVVATASKGDAEGHHGFDIDSLEGDCYILDMEFCLKFALENRKQMIESIMCELNFYLAGIKKCEPLENLINRNHNHADIKDGYVIHRKGATHAEKGMMGVIPGNMRDGSFIVEGKGNEDSLCSSSHGAGRVMSRTKAKKEVNLADFEKQMEGVTAKVGDSTIDESPSAYKNIFEVMDLQKDLVEVKHHLKPIINIKA